MAEDSIEPVVTPYFGISMPFPDTIPILIVNPEKGPPLTNRSLIAWLSVDEKGKVKKVEYPSDSAAYIKPIKKDLKKIRFHFMGGIDPKFPVEVPVRVTYLRDNMSEMKANLAYPVSAELITDTTLLPLFFERNGIEAPSVVDLNPFFYKVYPNRKESDYLIITARVFLDEKGRLQNITYPIPGQEVMNHPVHMALMNAEFSPAGIDGRTHESDFLLTFRIFDNIRYPFSPLHRNDTSSPAPISSYHVMTYYFNAADMALPPLPRNHGNGIIKAANLARGRRGTAEVHVRINSEGKTTGVSVTRAGSRIGEVAGKVAKLIQWYPAKNNSGETESFVGTINLTFDGSTEIVCIPEWLKP